MRHVLLALLLLLLSACPQDETSAAGTASAGRGAEAGAGGFLRSSAGAGVTAAGRGGAGGSPKISAAAGQGGAGRSSEIVADAGQGGEGGSTEINAEAGHGGAGGASAGQGGAAQTAGQGGSIGGSGGQGGSSNYIGGHGGTASAGSGGQEPECVDGNAHCDGLTVISCSSGQWVPSETCPYLCSDGACSGSCEPGAQQCSAFGSQTCSTQGQWVTDQGTCTPNARRCENTLSQVYDTCGNWVTEETCPYVCSGAGVCGGSCVPESERCSGNDQQICDDTGSWDTAATCPYVCANGACTGVCVPGQQRCAGVQIQTCDSSGNWGTALDCQAVTGAVTACDASTNGCTASCDSDHDDCNGDMSDGCEVDLTLDSNNCGACGHDCCGGSCVSGQCTVYQTNIWANQWDVSSYAVDQDYIYWSGGTTLNRRPRMGGATSAIVTESVTSGTVGINHVAVNADTGTIAWSSVKRDAQHVLVGQYLHTAVTSGNVELREVFSDSHDASGNSVQHSITSTQKISRQGGAPVNVVGLDTDNVVWMTPYTLSWETIGSTTPTTVATPDFLFHFVSDGDYLYTVTGDWGYPLVRYTLSDGSKTVMFDPANTNPASYWFFYRLALDRTHLYYRLEDDPTSETGIWKMPRAGGEPVQLFSAEFGSGREMVTDGAYVYFETITKNPQDYSIVDNTRLRKVSVDGGLATDIVTLNVPKRVMNLKVYDECLYFTVDNQLHAVAVAP